jgi:hypothetical protein
MLALFALALSFVLSPDSLREATPLTQTVVPSALPCPGGQVLDGQTWEREIQTIDASGAVRLAGLVRLLDTPRAGTVHGFLWPTFWGGAAPGSGSQPLVLIDGEPLAPDLMGLGDLERTPADVPDLASVTYCPGPYLADGRLWQAGVLLLETNRAYMESDRDYGARGSVFIGNEVGDPGPFRYTGLNRNVDKFGPDYSGTLFWLGPYERDSRLEARFKIRRFYATDPEIAERTFAVTDDFPRLRLLSGEVRGHFDAFNARQRVSLMASGGNVLPLVPSLGQEVPVRPIWAQASLSGKGVLSDPLVVAYRIRASHERTETRNPLYPALLEWNVSTVHATAELNESYHGEGSAGPNGTAGLSLTYTRPDVPGAPEPFVLARLYAERRSHRGALTATAVAGSSGVGGSATLVAATDHAHGSLTGLLGTLSASHVLPEEEPHLGFWQHHGFTGFQSPGITRTVQDPKGRTELLVRGDLDRRIGGPTRLTASAGLRAARGLGLDQSRFVPFTEDQVARGTSTYRADASGISGHLAMSVEHRVYRLLGFRLPNTGVRAFADARTPLTGSDPFRQAWRTVPVFRSGVSMLFQPEEQRPSFSVFTSAEVRSATRWPAYAGVGRDRTPPVVLLDAALRKTFVGGRLQTSLLFRNLLSAPERYHPIGAELDLRLYARAVLQLP